MSWKRLPTFFANIPLKLMPLSEGQQKAFETNGSLKQVAFQTIPSVNKLELRKYLESVYGLSVASLRTLNYEGAKKRGKHGFFRRPDYKKVYVTFKGSDKIMPHPVAPTSAQDNLQETAPSVTQDSAHVTTNALPMLTPIAKSKPDSLPSTQQQPALPPPQASPKIKPPPGFGSQSLKHPALPLWQMFGSSVNTPALMAGMSSSGESLNLDVLAKAAVRKRKEQECQRAEAAARDSVIAELQRRAARQAAISAVAQQHAMTWLQAPMDADDADYVKHHVDIIQSLLLQAKLLPDMDAKPVAKPGTCRLPTAVAQTSAADAAALGEASIHAAAKVAAAEQAAGLATAATIADPVAAASVKAAAVDWAAAVVGAAVTDASAAEATANSAAAVAALQAAAADGAAPAAAVAQAVNEAAKALAAAKAKATATAEAALQAAVAQEEERVVKKANAQLFLPLTQGLGRLVDYPSDEDSHMSGAFTGSQTHAQADVGETEVTSAERQALAASQHEQSDALRSAQPSHTFRHQPASWLPMYSMDPSSSHHQASSGIAADSVHDASRDSPRAGQSACGAGLTGAALPCLRLSGQQLGEVLDSMRELSSVHMNLSLLHGTDALGFVDRLKHSPEASVAFMAGTMSNQWWRSLASHLHTVTQPWPACNLRRETDQLLLQCASKWGLPLPPAPEATPAPAQAYGSGSKKKRKRDGWDSKKGGKGAAALLRASGSAPEAQTLHQLSQAKQAESVESRRLKRDLQTLHTRPSTLPPTPHQLPATTAAPAPAPADVIAAGSNPVQQNQIAPDVPHLQPAQALLDIQQAASPEAATGAPLHVAASEVAAASTGVEESTPVGSTQAQKAAAACISAADGPNDVIDLAGSEAADDQDIDIRQSATAASDEDMPQAAELAQQDPQTSKASVAPEPADAALHSAQPEEQMQSQQGQDRLPQVTHDATDMQTEGSGEMHAIAIAGDDLQVAADALDAAEAAQESGQEDQPEQPHQPQAKAAATTKQKGKRKAAATQKGSAKRQKGKREEREPSPAPEKAATSALNQAAAAAAAAAASKPTAAANAKPAVSAATAKTGAAKNKKGAAAAIKAGPAEARKASAKSSAATSKKGGASTSAASRKAETAAAVDDDDDHQSDDKAADVPVDTQIVAEESAVDPDEAAAEPAVATRDRRGKAKEVKTPSVPQPGQPVKKANKQQKLPFAKVPASSPKQSKATSASASAAASSGAAGGTASKTGKGRAAPDRKSGASTEPASNVKELRGKQVKASPKKAVAAPAKQQSKSGKQQKQKPASGKDSKAAEDATAEGADQEPEEEVQEPMSDGEQTTQDTPIGYAASYLKQQQKQIADSPYPKLKPLVLAACKGTLDRLSKMPGWKRQSARKKHYASCDAVLQASVAKHKGDCADVTKKRAKKEVLRLVDELVTAVEDLAR